MSDKELRNTEQFLRSIDQVHVGAAISKLFAASIGDLVVLFSKSAAHKHYALADIEWMVMPPVAAGQFYVAEAEDQKQGFRAPIAAVTWAFVSVEVDERLRQARGQRLRLRPDEWKSGELGWLIDIVGDSKGLDVALQWLAAGPFKDRPLNLFSRDESGEPRPATLTEVMAAQAGTSVA